MKKSNYNADSIRTLKYPDNVRHNAGMYIGPVDKRGLLHLFKEILDNSTDEIAESKGTQIDVFFDGSGVWIADNGRGIPTGESKDIKGKSVLTTIFTDLHAGSKTVDTGAYKSARGCFTGDTKIKLLDGTSVSIGKLARQFQKSKKKHWVYAFSKDAAKQGFAFVPREAYGVFATRKTDTLAVVELDNGEIIKCTVDHPFMLWDGSYVQAQNLKESDSLRAIHFMEDKDGYLTHSAVNKITKPQNRFNNYVHRTVAEFQGIRKDGEQISHKNADKQDNRPQNLQSLNNKDHWWYDHNKHGKNSSWTNKTELERETSRSNMESLNEVIDLENIQIARYVQVAARAYRDFGIVNEETYNACRGWCYPKFDKAEKVLGSKLTSYAKKYLKKYGPNGRTDNGGNGLSYKLESEYENSPASNYNNHKVVSVKIKKLKKPIQVYGMSVDTDHNYLLDAGVFVANTHGVGAAVVNALSKKLIVWSHHTGRWQRQEFDYGKETTKVIPSQSPNKQVRHFALKKGSCVYFVPDKEIFKDKFDADALREMVELSAYFLPKVKFTFRHEDHRQIHSYKKTGLHELVEKTVDGNGMMEVFKYSSDKADIAFTWQESLDDNMRSFVSGGESHDGGTHQKAFEAVLLKCIKQVASRAKNIPLKYFTKGLVSAINVRIHHPVFDSQTKNRLTSPEGRKAVQECEEAILKYLTKNKSVITKLTTRAKAIQDAEKKTQVSVEAAAKLKSPRGKVILPEKLTVATTKDWREKELFILEGDSAGGTAKKARDTRYQEVLTLRGKFTNPFRHSEAQILKNESVLSIFQAIGYDPVQRKIVEPRVHKVLFLSDADEDGQHINALLTSLFVKYMPELFEQKRIFSVYAPLFKGRKGETNYYGSSYNAIKKQVDSTAGLSITRFKGWGEANADELKDIAFNPNTRKLLNLKQFSEEQLNRIKLIIGDNSDARKELLGV